MLFKKGNLHFLYEIELTLVEDKIVSYVTGKVLTLKVPRNLTVERLEQTNYSSQAIGHRTMKDYSAATEPFLLVITRLA